MIEAFPDDTRQEQAHSGRGDLAAKHVVLNKLIDAQLARQS
jgi:hypothetical protein